MMNYEDFKKNLLKAVEEEIESRGLEDISCRFDNIDAPDGMNDRMIVSVEGSKMSMAFRLQEIYNDVNAGENLLRAADRMVNTIEANVDVCKSKENDVKDFVSDYEQVRKHTYLRLLPGNSPVLKDTPHKDIGDMALVVNIHLLNFSDENGRSCVVVTKPLMEMYGIEEDQLFFDAKNNSVENEPMVFTPLGDMIKPLLEEENIPSPEEAGIVTYIATTKSGFQGASVLAYPEFAEKAAETIGGSFYMLPSSVHEFILIKDDGRAKAKELNKMIKNVNETVLEARDYLSDQCYHYDAIEKKLTFGTDHDKEKAQKKAQKKDIEIPANKKFEAPDLIPDELIPDVDIDNGPDL